MVSHDSRSTSSAATPASLSSARGGVVQPGGGAQHADLGGHDLLQLATLRPGDQPGAARVGDGLGPVAQLGGEHGGDPTREHQALEEAVGREPVGAVHAGAGDLAGRVEAGHVGAAPEVGPHAAAGVVAGGRDGDQVGDRVDAVGAGGGQDGREPALPELRAEVPGVEPHVRVPGLDHPAHDRLGHDVARRQVGQLVDALHEPVALEVDEEGALAAHGLGDQRLLAAGLGAEVHHGRVELDELQVAEGGAGAQGQRHAVAGRDRRVGGLGEHLAEATRGEHDGPAADRADSVALALADHVQGDPGYAAVVGEQQVDGERVLDHLDLGCPLDRGDQRPLDLGAGGVAAGVRDPVAVVAALAGQRQLAVGAVVEVGAERDQLVDRLGALADQHPYGVEVAGAGAGDEGVDLVLLGGVARAERGGDAALGPLGRAGGQHVLGDDQDLVAPLAERHAAAAPRSARRCRSR